MTDVDILARTIYGEARGEPQAGKIAVAWVVRNRAKIGGWWGATIAEVCLARKQFSCWDDANRVGMLRVENDDPVYRNCLRAAMAVIDADADDDPTRGSTHYHATHITPGWADAHKQTAIIGRHKFYRLRD